MLKILVTLLSGPSYQNIQCHQLSSSPLYSAQVHEFAKLIFHFSFVFQGNCHEICHPVITQMSSYVYQQHPNAIVLQAVGKQVGQKHQPEQKYILLLFVTLNQLC